jgi:hypothetical protein
MTNATDFDVAGAHRYFSTACFNQAWDLLDKPDRTPAEDEQMLHLGMASLWHWSQRPDCTDTNLSVGYWQVSRIYAVLGHADNARHYAERCLDVSQGEGIPPFYLGYAYEALARAEMVAGNTDGMVASLQEARRVADTVPDVEARQMLQDDLATIA